jgi:hypothetical protein
MSTYSRCSCASPPDSQQACEAFVAGGGFLFRGICLTDNHRICLAPGHIQEGDIIVVFRGAPNLYVILPSGHGYLYVGDAYMYGVMDGELTEKEGWENSIEEFTLV